MYTARQKLTSKDASCSLDWSVHFSFTQKDAIQMAVSYFKIRFTYFGSVMSGLK